MKNLQRALFYALAILWIASLTSQANADDKKITRKDVPVATLKAFEAAFPKVTVNAYLTEKEDGKTFYEFETVEGTIKRDILYTPEGTLVEVERFLLL